MPNRDPHFPGKGQVFPDSGDAHVAYSLQREIQSRAVVAAHARGSGYILESILSGARCEPVDRILSEQGLSEYSKWEAENGLVELPGESALWIVLCSVELNSESERRRNGEPVHRILSEQGLSEYLK